MVALADSKVEVKCSQCNSVQVFSINPVKLEKWMDGSLYIQDAFPAMSVNDRETLVSYRSSVKRNTPVICGNCFDKMFGESDD